MIPLTLAQIADAVGGELSEVPDPQAIVTGSVEFDSRKIGPGGLFVALAGTKVDGHSFALKAVEDGAVAALTARAVPGVLCIIAPPIAKVHSDELQDNADAFANDDDGCIRAVLHALGALARTVVLTLTQADTLRVVGLTGSAGKTSTKDILASVLRVNGASTVAPPGSFNNEIGHPYTALRCDEDTQYLVAEMSARGVGHIAHLATIAPPSVGIVLNVGTAHLGEFGSREVIARAKGELVEALPAAANGGVAILNADDPLVAGMASRTSAKVVRFSAEGNREADVIARDIILDKVARAGFTLIVNPGTEQEESYPVQLGVFGEHQVANALAAAAAGIQCGIPVEDVARALTNHRGASAHRMDVHTREDQVTIINDAYNANPDSMRAGIQALAHAAKARENAVSWAVLGAMGELGLDSIPQHRALGEYLAQSQVDNLVVVGESAECAAMAEAAQTQGITLYQVPDAAQATQCVSARLRSGDVVLVKASHTQRLWEVAEALETPQDITDQSTQLGKHAPEETR